MAIEVREYAVEVFAENMLLHGHVSSARRLTDLVNEDEPYVAIDDVHIFPYQPDVMLGLEEHGHGMVNKTSIVLVTELTQVGMETTDAERMGVRVFKTQHRVLIYANQFAINANIHLAPAVELGSMLGQAGVRFIPVTDATVTPTQSNTQLTSFRRDFLLINTNQIQYLGGVDRLGGEPAVEARAEAGDELIG